jgi:RNA-binding, Nab2-type zinc finger
MSTTSLLDKASDDSSRAEDNEDNAKEKGNKAKPATKGSFHLRCTCLDAKTKLSAGKDLSHVPCKFFRVGSCTAGASCPFSHTAVESGQKDVCAWFVKGNCKFGHKCALAHILPGQSMSMDRKNKKAAQALSNSSAQGRDGGRTRGQKGRGAGAGSSANGQSRNPLLSGSTAPTRVLSGSPRASVTFKATISPSAPAPPVKDIDFASFGLPDETNKLPSAPAHGKSPPNEVSKDEEQSVNIPEIKENSPVSKSPLSPLLPCAPSAPRRVAKPSSPKGADFGPIGSAPHSASPANYVAPINGLSPGTSPSTGAGVLSSSPFSAPGHQSRYPAFDRGDDSSDFRIRTGLAASLGATRSLAGDFMSAPKRVASANVEAGRGDSAVEEEDLEEFLPGSLTDLLTPEERSRRLSRTNASRPAVGPWDPSQRPSVEAHHHRYSRSVPAPSLLNEIKSIWAEPGTGIAGSPDQRSSVGGLGNGTPSSFKSNSNFGGRALEETISPSNASAAFLSGMHHYFGKTGQQRSTRPPPSLHHSGVPGASSSNPSSLNAFGVGANGVASSTIPRTAFGNHVHEVGPTEHFTGHDFPGRPIPGFSSEEDKRLALSPSTRALQAHAPGQSLPQGLAAGYSRIHALPPTISPSTPGTFSPPKQSTFSSAGGDWIDHPGTQSGNLDAAMSRISYSARVPSGQLSSGTRHPSGRAWQNGPGLLSPLSRPVVTHDDDDLFSMDG